VTSFGELLKSDREKLRLSQEALAKMMNVSQQAVANWEAGTSHPKRERRVQLLQILGPNSGLARNPPRQEFLPSQDSKEDSPNSTTRAQRLERIEMPNHPEFLQQSEDSAKRLQEARLRIDRFLARKELDREEFVQALPKELHTYLDGQITVGAQTRRLDYLSPRWGIEIRRAPGNRFMTWSAAAPSLVKLAVVRGIADQGIRPPRDFSMVVVHDGLAMRADGTMQKLMFDAGVLGISVYQVETFAQAADLVRQLETEGEDVADETGEGLVDTDETP
jgi:transcriptional regulator with XRE-family HTH domain